MLLNSNAPATAKSFTQELVESFEPQQEIDNSNQTTINQINEYNKDLEIEADEVVFEGNQTNALGNVRISNRKFIITANRIVCDNSIKTLEAEGNIIIQDLEMGGVYFAQRAFFDIKNNKFVISEVKGNLRNARLAARNIKAEAVGVYTSDFTTFSLCNSCKNGKQISPLWQIRAEKLKADIKSNDEIKLHNVYLDIFEKQVLYLPYFSIPAFWTGGKTGFLMPKFKYSKDLKAQINIPFYWNPTKNMDFIFTRTISKKPMYGLDVRHKFDKGGYEISIKTAQLPFAEKFENADKKSIFRAWPADVKIQANFLEHFDRNRNTICDLNKRAYELGINGEIGLGTKPILLYKYDISNKKILVGRTYGNVIYDTNFLSTNAIHFHDLKNNRRLVSLPKVEFLKVNKFKLPYFFSKIFSDDPALISSVSMNGLYNETFSREVSDAIGGLGLLLKTNLNDNTTISYRPNLLFHQATSTNNNIYEGSQKSLKPSLDIHFASQFFHMQKIIEPHIILRLEPKSREFFVIDKNDLLIADGDLNDNPLSLYSTTNNLNMNNVFSDGLYSTGNRSINIRPGHHMDYGFILGHYNFNKVQFDSKFTLTVAARQYLSIPRDFKKKLSNNADFIAANLQDKYKDKYVMQMYLEQDDLFINNKSWFTNEMKLSNNEIYFEKKFKKFATGFKYLFFNKRLYLNPYKSGVLYNKILSTDVKYNVTENILFSVQNSFKFGERISGKNVSNLENVKLKLEYSNECAIIGFSMKREFYKKSLNNKVNTYRIYFKIPQIFL